MWKRLDPAQTLVAHHTARLGPPYLAGGDHRWETIRWFHSVSVLALTGLELGWDKISLSPGSRAALRGAGSAREYWDNVLGGVDSVHGIPL